MVGFMGWFHGRGFMVGFMGRFHALFPKQTKQLHRGLFSCLQQFDNDLSVVFFFNIWRAANRVADRTSRRKGENTEKTKTKKK